MRVAEIEQVVVDSLRGDLVLQIIVQSVYTRGTGE